MGVVWGSKFWLIFCISHCSDECNITYIGPSYNGTHLYIRCTGTRVAIFGIFPFWDWEIYPAYTDLFNQPTNPVDVIWWQGSTFCSKNFGGHDPIVLYWNPCYTEPCYKGSLQYTCFSTKVPVATMLIMNPWLSSCIWVNHFEFTC